VHVHRPKDRLVPALAHLASIGAGIVTRP
jgi:hypothetical protein